MSNYFGISSSGVSSLFSSLNSGSSIYSTGSSASESPLSTYMSIRNGSYSKLLKAYYSETGNKSAIKSTSTSIDSTKTLAAIESTSDALKDISDELFTGGKNSVFNKVTTTGDDGTKTESYNTDAIYKKVNAFVNAYNDFLEEAGKSNTTDILRRTKSIIGITNTYGKVLNKAGVTIGKDNKLSIDEETFKKADMTTVKNIFNGRSSLAYSISANASYINYTAQYQASKANTYTSYGNYSYNYSAGNIFNSFS